MRAWSQGVVDTGGFISKQMAKQECAHGHPNINGVWLDWEPHNGASEEYVRELNV